MSWKTAQDNIAAQGVLIIEGPERMRLEIQDPVGGTQALLILNGERFFWFMAEAAHNWAGPVAKLHKVATVSLSGEQLVRVLLGSPNLSGFVSKSEGEWEKETEVAKEHIFANSSGELGVWNIAKKNTAWTMHASYENYAVRSGVSVPYLTQIELLESNKLKSRFVWKWNDFRFEGATNDALLRIPSGAFLGKPTKVLR